MPGGDRTGPMGMGPMTGRAAGYCAGYEAPGYANPVPGRGFGMGFGRGRGRGGAGRGFGGGGRGWRHQYYATGLPGWARFGAYPNAANPYATVPPAAGPWQAGSAPYSKPDPEWEKQALKSQAETLQAEAKALQAGLDFIQKRLDEIEKPSETK